MDLILPISVVAAPNKIPKAGGDGKIDVGYIPVLSGIYQPLDATLTTISGKTTTGSGGLVLDTLPTINGINMPSGNFIDFRDGSHAQSIVWGDTGDVDGLEIRGWDGIKFYTTNGGDSEKLRIGGGAIQALEFFSAETGFTAHGDVQLSNHFLIDESADLLTIANTARFTGEVDQTPQGVIRVDVGIDTGAGTPRIILEQPFTTPTVWIVDNNTDGRFRFYIPSVEVMSISVDGSNHGSITLASVGATQSGLILRSFGTSQFLGGGVDILHGNLTIEGSGGTPATAGIKFAGSGHNAVNFQSFDNSGVSYAFFGTNREYTGSGFQAGGFDGTRTAMSLQIENNNFALYNFPANSNTASQVLRVTPTALILTSANKIQPSSDSTTAIQFADATGTAIAAFDTSNSRLIFASGKDLLMSATGRIGFSDFNAGMDVSSGITRVKSYDGGAGVWDTSFSRFNFFVGPANDASGVSTGSFSYIYTNANTVPATALTLNAVSSVTPTAGFGGSLLFQGYSDANALKSLARINTTFTTVADLTRQSNLSFSIFNVNTETPVLIFDTPATARAQIKTLTTLVGATFAGSTVFERIFNLDNTNLASNAQLQLVVGGISAGDASVLYQIPSGASWIMGIDNSDSDKFKLSMSSALGTTDVMTFDTSGIAQLIQSALSFTQLAAPGAMSAPALAGAGAGNVDNGAHLYKVTFVNAVGETMGGTASASITVVDKTTNGKVSLTGIPVGATGTTSRKVYRTIAGGAFYFFVTTIADNTTTTFTDNLSDATIAAAGNMPVVNTTGGVIKPAVNSTSSIVFTNVAGTPQAGFDTTNGRMFIGNVAPQALLHIYGNSPQLQVDSLNGSTLAQIVLSAAGGTGTGIKISYDDGAGFGFFDSVWNSDNGGFKFRMRTSGTPAEVLVLTNVSATLARPLVLSGAPGIIKPAADSTTAIQVTNVAGTVFVTFDTANRRAIFGGASYFDASGSLTMGNNINGGVFLPGDTGNVAIRFGTGLGAKIGDGATQKIGIWNATPIVQPANTVAIDTAFANIGLRASGGLANFDSNAAFAGLVGIGTGTTTPSQQLHLVNQGSATTRGINMGQYSSDTRSNNLYFTKSRGTFASQTVVANGDFLGVFFAQAYSGASYFKTASFGFIVNGTVSGSSIPTDIVFAAGAVDDGSFTNERMRINASGRVTLTAALFMPSQYTTAGRPSYVKGAVIFDTDLSKLVVGGAVGWEVVTSV